MSVSGEYLQLSTDFGYICLFRLKIHTSVFIKYTHACIDREHTWDEYTDWACTCVYEFRNHIFSWIEDIYLNTDLGYICLYRYWNYIYLCLHRSREHMCISMKYIHVVSTENTHESTSIEHAHDCRNSGHICPRGFRILMSVAILKLCVYR